jgi:hypothetical protein
VPTNQGVNREESAPRCCRQRNVQQAMVLHYSWLKQSDSGLLLTLVLAATATALHSSEARQRDEGRKT